MFNVAVIYTDSTTEAFSEMEDAYPTADNIYILLRENTTVAIPLCNVRRITTRKD